MPRIELACDGLKTWRGEGINRDLSEELTGDGGGGDGDSEESLGVSEVNL
jgi:hypothetical protein